MQKRFILSVLAAATVASLAVCASAQTDINSHIIDPNVVERIGTSLNHASIIQFPEPVTGAVIGSEEVRMEFRDNLVILEPNQAGIKTNLFVWTAHHQLSYEVMPAGQTSQLSYVIRETLQPPPPPPPGPSPEEAQTLRDSTHDAFIMTTRDIAAPHYKGSQPGVHLRVEQVAEDSYSYYVRLTAVNRTSHLYRISTPVVNHIIPTFGAKMAVRSVNEQLTEKKFAKVLLFDSEASVTHGSSLRPRDLRPGEQAHWAMAISKTGHSPAMYEFVLPADGDQPIHAVVVF
jgi:hypothetical protein